MNFEPHSAPPERRATPSFALERIGLAAQRAPLLSLGLLILLTVLAVAGMTQLRFEDDPRSMLKSDRERFQTYDRFRDAYPALENQMFLLIEGADLVSRHALEAIRSLHLDLQFVDGVTNVISIFTARHPPDDNDDMAPVLPDDLPEGEALRALVAEARAHPLLTDKMLARDGTATLLVIGLHDRVSDYEDLQILFADIGEIVDAAMHETDITVTPTGLPALRHEMLTSVRKDQHILNLAGAAIAIIVCALYFRHPAFVLLASAPPVLAIVWTLGGFGLSGERITALSNILPTLILVIAFSDALHMVHAIRSLLARGAAVDQAVRTAVVEVGPACAMTSVTTMIALGSLIFAESRLVQQFGACGTLAVFMAFVAVVALIPALAMIILPRVSIARSVEAPTAFSRAAQAASMRLWTFVRVRPLVISAVATGLLFVTGAAFFALEPRYDYRAYLAEGSAANAAIDRVNEKLGGADLLFVLVSRIDGQRASLAPLEAVAQVHDIVVDVPEIENALSLASARTWFEGASGEARTGTEGAGAGSADAAQLVAGLPDYYAQRLAGRHGESWLVTAYMPAEAAPETRARLEVLERELVKWQVGVTGYDARVTGIGAVAAFESGRMIDRLKYNLTAAVFVIVLVIGFAARSLMLGLLSIVPNLAALTVVAAALYVMGTGFQYVSVVALTVAFGIAVDNTVHFVHRYRLERGTADIDGALAGTMRTVGPVLIAATAVLVLGIAVTQVSILPMVNLFGRLCIIVLIVALAATMLFLPALVLAMRRRGSGL